jgi:hypothetical protein
MTWRAGAASRGLAGGVERAGAAHFRLDALHGAGANAAKLGGFKNARALA